jgi:hypothetical protein
MSILLRSWAHSSLNCLVVAPGDWSGLPLPRPCQKRGALDAARNLKHNLSSQAVYDDLSALDDITTPMRAPK